MATIFLVSSGSGIYDHKHIQEDITYQSDGYNLLFSTTFPYMPGTLSVVYNGIVYSKENDFTETDNQHFLFTNDEPFPPEIDLPLIVQYHMIIS